ncbi:MAG: L-malate glycosyltransferase, partial [Verrucomicrobiota bacterium]
LIELGLRQQVIVREQAAIVEEYLPAGDAGLYTSEKESFGLSILETMFFGKPVVAFRIGGIPEVVGEAAYLHDFEDIAGMASSLDALVDSPEIARELGERSRARAEKYFSAAHIVPRYEAVYRQFARN